MMVAVLNGVNLNLLGRRDPAHYGTMTLQLLESAVYGWAGELGLTARCFQTNHEGTFIEHLHDAEGWAGGVIVNPGAWTHYAYSIRDAVEFLPVPVVEVHLSDVAAREPFRRLSVIADVVAHRVVGKGPEGYHEALAWLAGGGRSAA
jgi:3-dehydroquinate dehydratase-2